MRIRPLLLAATLTLTACTAARRYPPAPQSPPAAVPAADAVLPAHWSWMRPLETPRAIPLEFVSAASPAWAGLPAFWNDWPPPAAGMRTLHVGLPPLQAVGVLVAAEQIQTIRIKVPLGLPDPTELIPPANRPTYGKWRLGKQLFFAPLLRSGTETFACATCHQPAQGFTERWRVHPGATIRTPSLVNAVYNRRQFWDGRVRTLEETVVRSLADEEPSRIAPEVSHRWGGMVRALAADDGFRNEFEQVFGIRQPTQDAIARALATYMRTILAGDSLYDRAEAARRQAKAPALTEVHFRPLLGAAVLKTLGNGTLPADVAARRLVLGDRLFQGKAKCAVCHPAPLFTDRDFHNIGLDTADSARPTGRFATVPIGLKEQRLIGAHKTPTLRARIKTAPYFHDGRRRSLSEVIGFYDHEVLSTPYLAAPLRMDDRDPQLGLSDDEIAALALFVQGLDGTPVDRMVTLP